MDLAPTGGVPLSRALPDYTTVLKKHIIDLNDQTEAIRDVVEQITFIAKFHL